MKLAVTATGDRLDSEVDPRFGRCRFIIFIDSETMDFKAVANVAGSGGAGIAAGQLVAEHGAEVLLTGDCGPNAYHVLNSAGIKVITGVHGKVKDAVEAFKTGKYRASDHPSVQPHHGQKLS